MKKRAKVVFTLSLLLSLTSYVQCRDLEKETLSFSEIKDKKKAFSFNKGVDDFEENHDAMSSNNSLYFTRNEEGRLIDVKETKAVTSFAVKDQYGNNDSFSKATVALDATHFNKKSFSNIYTVLGGTIHTKDDVDYYSYDTWGKGTLKIELIGIPSNCDYDIELYHMGNSLNSKCESSELVGSSKHSSNLDEKIELSVIPGTYYVKVFSYKGYDENDNYQLTFSFHDSLEDGKGKFNISEAKNRGEIAAVWKSDYLPCSQNIMGNEIEKSNISYSNYGTFPLITHLTDAYSKDDDIDYMCLYVWDNNLKKLIRHFAGGMYDLLVTKYKDGNPVLSDVTCYFENMSYILSVGGLVLGSIPFDVTQILGVVLSAVSIQYTKITTFLNFFNKKFKTTASDLKAYFASLNTAMENTKETVMMKIRYRFTKEYFTRYIDIHQTYRAADETIYNEDVITSYEHPGSSMSGKVYGISSMDELEELMK